MGYSEKISPHRDEEFSPTHGKDTTTETLEKCDSAAHRLPTEGAVTGGPAALSHFSLPPKTSAPTAGVDGGESDGDGDGQGERAGLASTSRAGEETYPEGGWRAWSVVLGSFLALFSGLGIMNSLATFHAYIGSHQLAGYSEGSVGWIFSVYTCLTFGGGLFIGPVFDKYGPRWLILSGTIGVVAGLMLLSICTKYWHFMLTFGVLLGLGTSLIFTPAIAAVGHWFLARRGFATGVASSGGSIGGIVFPLVMHDLFDRIGYAWTVRTLGFIALVLCGISNFLIRSRLPPAVDASAVPDFRILRSAAFSFTTAGVFLLEFSLFIPLTYISSYMLHKGFDEDFSYQILAVLNAGSVTGRVLAGWGGDIFGAFNSNMAAVALSVVACLGIWLPAGHTTAGIVVFVLMFGFCSGNNISISPVCIGRLCKTQDYGRFYSTTYTLVSVACLIGIPIGGEIISSNGGEYWGLIICTGVIYVGSFAALFGAKVMCVGWKFWAIF